MKKKKFSGHKIPHQNQGGRHKWKGSKFDKI